MTKLIPSFNRARVFAGVDSKGRAYAFVKVPAKNESGISVSINVDPTEWFALANHFSMFDVVEVPVENIATDTSGRVDTNGVPFKHAVNPSWGEATIVKKGFGVLPSFESLKKDADLTKAVAAQTVANASDDI